MNNKPELTSQFKNCDELCSYVHENYGDTVLLSFSGGKDSTGAWLQLRKYFSDIIPFFMWTHPNIKFVNDYLKYCEDFFGTRIIRLPNPSTYRFINNYIMQSPDRIEKIKEYQLQNFEHDDLTAIIRMQLNLSETVYQANGVRARDNLNRWASIKKYGSINHNRRTFSPIFDWDKARLVSELRNSGIRLPADYRLFGRTFDGIDYRFLKPVHDHYKDDYQLLLELCPFADMELFRMEKRAEYLKGIK